MAVSEIRREYLKKGLECLQRGDFFDAHEEWEIPWKDMTGHVRSFWQAMIQLSVGAYHFQNGNLRGCRNLWHKALKRCNEILEENLARDRQCVMQLKEILSGSLQKSAAGQNPLPEIQRFALEVVTEDWFDFE